jgi:hypothetical protein
VPVSDLTSIEDKKMNMISKIFSISAISVAFIASPVVQADDLQTLKNMERERSSLIETLLDLNMTPADRSSIIDNKVRRLVDLERMVLRDGRLDGNTHFLVRRAFADYDMTFLAHTSVENDQAVVGHWLNQVGLSNAAIFSAGKGIR